MNPSPFLQPYHLWKIAVDPLGFLRHMSSTYGDVVRFRVGLQRVILLNNASYVRELLVAKHRSFSKTRSVRMLGALLGEGLLTSEGRHHDRMRSIVRPVFQQSAVAHHAVGMVGQVTSVSARWQDGESISCLDVSRAISIRIICSSMFGFTDRSMDEVFFRAADCTELIYKRSLNPLAAFLDRVPNHTTRTIREARSRLDTAIEEIVRQSVQGGISNSGLLNHLLSPAHGLSAQQVRDEIATVIATGHETTAVALAWSLFVLAGRPADAERVGDDSQKGFDFTIAFVKEVLRLYPPVYAFGRNAVEDCMIHDVAVRKGDVVHVSPYLLQRDPRYFGDPGTFRPERWLDQVQSDVKSEAYIPFGTGPRGCPGENLAWLELSTSLRVLLRDWRFERVDSIEPGFAPSITLRPRKRLVIRVRKRVDGSNGEFGASGRNVSQASEVQPVTPAPVSS